MDDSKRCLDIFHRNIEDVDPCVTMDETWIHYFNLESNRQSAQWIGAGVSRPKRPKSQTSAGKVMESVFWDAQGILFVDYLEKRRTINSEYYMKLLMQLKDEIAQKRPGMKNKKSSFIKIMRPRTGRRLQWQNW